MTAKNAREERPSSRSGQPRVAGRGGRNSLREAADSESGTRFAPLALHANEETDARGAHRRMERIGEAKPSQETERKEDCIY